jgi:predicted O-methyltransferase YrrM
VKHLLAQYIGINTASPARIAGIVSTLVAAGVAVGEVAPKPLAAAGRVAAGSVAGFLLTHLAVAQHQKGERRQQELRELWGLGIGVTDGRVLPAPGGWALDPAAISWLWRRMQAAPPDTIVELGPGTSSVLLRLAANQADAAPIMYGLEHDPKFVASLNEQFAYHGLDYEMIHAPLAGRWYRTDVLDQLPHRIDWLIIDGPPSWDGGTDRSLAWDHLADRLAPGALIVFDDTDRPRERAAANRVAHFPQVTKVYDGDTFVVLEIIDAGSLCHERPTASAGFAEAKI